MDADEVFVRCCGVCQCPLILELGWCRLGFSEVWAYFQGATPKRCGWEWRLWNCNNPKKAIDINDNYPEFVPHLPLRHGIPLDPLSVGASPNTLVSIAEEARNRWARKSV
jgi:hypothetical protein